MQTKVLALFGLTLLLLSGRALAHAGHDHEHDEHEHDEEEENAGKASAVTALTPETFDEFINGHELVMVKFFAPWCGHCKALAPEYEKAAADLAGQGIELTEVDCTVHRDLCSRFDVQGFPTVKVFHGSATAKPVDYDQERKAEAIKKFLQKQKQPVFVMLDSKAALDAAVAEKDFVVVAFLAADDAAGKEAFVTVAGNMRNDFDFAIVTSAAVAQEAGAQVPSVVIFKKTDAPKEAYTGEMSSSAIEKFIKMHSLPLLGAIGPENYSKYLQRGFPLVWVFVNLDKDQAVVDAATEAAKQFVGKLSFVKLDAVRWEQHGKNLGLKKAPGVVISEQETRKNFVFDQELTADNLIAWVNSYLEKKLTPNLKSEPIPETNDGPVKIVVGKTYEQIVLDSSKDVLLEFYAPWCGHCKALAPKYEALAQQFKSVPSVVIAKIDATENDTPIDIKGFPTLYFFPANAKSAPMQYDGERTTEALAKYVRENAATLKTASTEAKTVKEDL